jgi:hypothetical protein
LKDLKANTVFMTQFEVAREWQEFFAELLSQSCWNFVSAITDVRYVSEMISDEIKTMLRRQKKIKKHFPQGRKKNCPGNEQERKRRTR